MLFWSVRDHLSLSGLNKGWKVLGEKAERAGYAGLLCFPQSWEQHWKEIGWTSRRYLYIAAGIITVEYEETQSNTNCVLAERRLHVAWKRRRCSDLTALVNVTEWVGEEIPLGETAYCGSQAVQKIWRRFMSPGLNISEFWGFNSSKQHEDSHTCI